MGQGRHLASAVEEHFGEKGGNEEQTVLSCHDFILRNFARPLSLGLQKILLSQPRTKSRGKEKIGYVCFRSRCLEVAELLIIDAESCSSKYILNSENINHRK